MDGAIALRYRSTSSVSEGAVGLATTGETAFFDGFVEQPAQTAQALLCVAKVARTRFYTPPSMTPMGVYDPVVTAEPDRLRFESFSACCGVHARLDLLDDGLDIHHSTPGTTNVDFNLPMRDALAGVAGRDPLRITVGDEAVAVETLDDAVVERKVPLPQRWVKGFGEVQVKLAGMRQVATLGPVETQRFVRALPRGAAGDATVWAEPAGTAMRVAGTERPGAVALSGPARLRVLEPLTRFATGLSVYTGDAGTVAWVLELDGGRLTVTLSPERVRGFSGEGGLLLDLVSPAAAMDALDIDEAMRDRTRFTADEAGASGAALTWLGIHGHLGVDVAEGAYFRRLLPYPAEALAADPPRLRDARKLAEADAVEPLGDGEASVVSSGREYRVKREGRDFSCTCPWIAKHGTERGPCKHVLAAAIVQERDFSASAES